MRAGRRSGAGTLWGSGAQEGAERLVLDSDEDWEVAQRLARFGRGRVTGGDDPQGRRFVATPMHRHFTEVRARDAQATGWFAEVVVLPRDVPRVLHHEGEVLLRAAGCSVPLMDRSQPLPYWWLRSYHATATATDLDHDPCVLAAAALNNPVLTRFCDDGRTEFTAVVSAARLYSYGKGPFDGREDLGTCTSEERSAGHSPGHRFGHALPPERGELDHYLKGALVSVHLLPMGLIRTSAS